MIKINYHVFQEEAKIPSTVSKRRDSEPSKELIIDALLVSSVYSRYS